jgi:monovalent cation/proton antiporter MnhG/PhaG subunit
MVHFWIMAVLLAMAVALTILCSIGVLIMRDPYQRLQFCTPLTTIGVALITIAVWIGDPSWQARLKMLCIALTLFWMNAILSHATARAIRIRRMGHFNPQESEEITINEDFE